MTKKKENSTSQCEDPMITHVRSTLLAHDAIVRSSDLFGLVHTVCKLNVSVAVMRLPSKSERTAESYIFQLMM